MNYASLIERNKTLMLSICLYIVYRDFCNFRNMLFNFGCALYYKLLFQIRLSDSVLFSVYMNIFEIFWTKCTEV